MNQYRTLPASRLDQAISFHRPDWALFRRVTLESPALEVMTDLKRFSAITIKSHEKLEAANEKMKQRGVRLLLVTDITDEILGVLTAADILGEKPLQFAKDNGARRKDITAQDIMSPQECIEVLDIAEVSRARVGDIVETLRFHERQHALVVDRQGRQNERAVRGIFSLTQIARQLGIPLQTGGVAQTLAQIAHIRNPMPVAAS